MERLGSGYHIKKTTFPLQSVLLFFSPLLWSVVLDGIGQLARGTGKLHKTSPSCAWIFLFSALWFWNSRVLKSLQQISPATEEFHTTCLQRPTHNLSTLHSLWVCVTTDQSSLSWPHCCSKVHTGYPWELLLLHFTFCHREKGWFLVLSALGTTAHLSWHFSKLRSHWQSLTAPWLYHHTSPSPHLAVVWSLLPINKKNQSLPLSSQMHGEG